VRTLTVDFRGAISHLPDGATLIVHPVGWEDYEHLLEDTADRPHLRVSYNCGKLEIMTPLPEHEEYARFIDDLVRVVAEATRSEP
jgi:Uma2 family endonuclease